MNEEKPPTTAVDVRALAVEGHETLEDVPHGDLLHLAEPTVGLRAGHWRAAGGSWRRQMTPDLLRHLQPVADAAAERLIAEGTPVHAARRAGGWTGQFPVRVRGLTLGALRAALERIDLPDDTVVAIAPADRPQESIGSPARPRVATGYYQPDPAAGEHGWVDLGEPDAETADESPCVPAVVLRPTH